MGEKTGRSKGHGAEKGSRSQDSLTGSNHVLLSLVKLVPQDFYWAFYFLALFLLGIAHAHLSGSLSLSCMNVFNYLPNCQFSILFLALFAYMLALTYYETMFWGQTIHPLHEQRAEKHQRSIPAMLGCPSALQGMAVDGPASTASHISLKVCSFNLFSFCP